ncbi:hypothetical protein [Desulfosporosinus orientis]|nr:hypothetical protein [Desulfosporosinus orientis]
MPEDTQEETADHKNGGRLTAGRHFWFDLFNLGYGLDFYRVCADIKTF